MEDDKGKIRNRNAAQQLVDFSGLRYGNITPTNIDLAIEYKNHCYIIGEGKYKNVSIPFGQKLCLERLCDDLSKVKRTLLIHYEHETPTHETVDVAGSLVREFRVDGAWHDAPQEVTVKHLTDDFIFDPYNFKNLWTAEN